MKMEGTNLVNGKKAELFAIFKSLQDIHGRRWLAELRKNNEWYKTRESIYAWENAMRGKAGNEVFRMIISDMQTIMASTRTKKAIKKQGLIRPVKA